jgi:WD40 repeat protein
MSTFSSSPSPGMPVKTIDPNDCNVPNAGTDGISSLCWSPTANILIGSSWDSTVSCWEVQEQGGRIQANPKAQSKIIYQGRQKRSYLFMYLFDPRNMGINY